MTTVRKDTEHFDTARLRFKNGGFPEFQTPYLSDQFTEDLVAGKWTATETGTGTSHAAFAVAATANDGGQAAGVAGATTNNAQELAAKHVIWKPSLAANAPVVLEARFKAVGTTTAKDGDFVLGLMDAATYTSGLAYVVSAASALTTTAPTEGVSFVYSSIPTSGALHPTSGNNYFGIVTTTVGVGTVAATTVKKDSLFHIFRIEVDASGNARFLIDGEDVGYVPAACVAATALTPYIAVVGKNSHANTGTLDYVFVGGDQASS